MTDLLHDMDIHTFFGLSYCNYLVLNRSLLQSMPMEWQHKFVRLLNELDDEFAHVETAQVFEVKAAREAYITDYFAKELEDRFGIRPDEPEPTNYEDDSYDDDYDYWCENVEWYHSDGKRVHPAGRILVPCDDPVPHYDRGRTHVATGSELGII